MITGLTASFYRVRKYLKLYHIDQYKNLRKSLWMYYLADVAYYAFFMLGYYAKMRWFYKFDYFFGAAFQAIGLVVFKRSQDPLSGSSALSYLKIISIN